MITAALPPRFVRDRATWLAYALSTYWAYVLNLLGPLTPFLRSELALTYTLASLHFSAFAAGMLLAGGIADRVVARLDRRRTLWTGAFGLAAGALVLMGGQQPLVTIAACFGMGLVGSWIQAVYPAVLAARHGRFAPIAFTEATILGSTGAALAALCLGLAAYTPAGWRVALLLPLLALVPIYLYFRGEPLATASPAATPCATGPQTAAPVPVGTPAVHTPAVHTPAGHTPAVPAPPPTRLPRAFWLYWTVLVFVIAIEFCIAFWVADFLHTARGLTPAAGALGATVFLGAMLLGRVISSRLLHRVRPQPLLLGSLAVTAGGFFLFWLLPALPLAIGGLVVAGLGVANFYPTTLALAVGTAPDLLDRASARASLASGTAILTLPLLLGRIADSVGILGAFALVPLLIVLAALLLLLVSRLPDPKAVATAEQHESGILT
jgi:MFS family permease